MYFHLSLLKSGSTLDAGSLRCCAVGEPVLMCVRVCVHTRVSSCMRTYVHTLQPEIEAQQPVPRKSSLPMPCPCRKSSALLRTAKMEQKMEIRCCVPQDQTCCVLTESNN